MSDYSDISGQSSTTKSTNSSSEESAKKNEDANSSDTELTTVFYSKVAATKLDKWDEESQDPSELSFPPNSVLELEQNSLSSDTIGPPRKTQKKVKFQTNECRRCSLYLRRNPGAAADNKIRFIRAYPPDLIGRVSEFEFFHTVDTVNGFMEWGEKSNVFIFLAGCFGGCAGENRRRQAMESASDFIADQNVTIYIPHQVRLEDPMENGFQYIEITLLDIIAEKDKHDWSWSVKDTTSLTHTAVTHVMKDLSTIKSITLPQPA